MRLPLPIDGYGYSRLDSFSEIRDLMASVGGWAEEDLGPATGTGLRVYGYRLGDTTERPTIYVQGAIHGDHEWRTTHWVVELMRILADPASRNVSIRGLWESLRQQFAFYFVPCVNPYGYLNGTYENGNGVNLNRNWGVGWYEQEEGSARGPEPYSEPETQAVKQILDNVRPVLFIDWHTWGHDGLGNVIHPPTDDTTYETRLVRYMRHVIQSGNAIGAVELRNPRLGGAGRARAYAQNLSTNWGVKPVTISPEVGGGFPEATQMRHAVYMNMLFFAVLSQWIRSRSYPVTTQ